MRLGGLGIRSASRMRHSAYWASWADSLQMISQSLPVVATQVLAHLTMDQRATGCLGELQEATDRLDHEGFVSKPEWTALRDGTRPPQADASEPGEWQHGWQYHASSSSEHHFRKSVVIAQSSVGDQAHLRSHSGPGASAVLLGCPTSCEFQLQPDTFRVLTLERLRLPIHVTEARCSCGAPLDLLGRHRGACPRSGRLKSRAVPTEHTLARVCREAGAVVRSNVKLRDMNVTVPVEDERAIEVVASGLPMLHGAQLAVDITLRSATSSDGWPQPNAAHTNGAALIRARRDKETKYAELVAGNRCRLVVVALETGGRWSDEAFEFCRHAGWSTRAGSSPCPSPVGASGVATPWTRMLAVSCARAFANSLVQLCLDAWSGTDGPTPDLADFVGEA